MDAIEREPFNRESWMTDDQWFCACLLADVVGGFHHVDGKFKECGRGVRITINAYRLSTFDSDRLTRLVLLAHDRCVRVDIAGGVARMVTLELHRRHKRDGDMMSRHPTVAEAIATHRRFYPDDASKGADPIARMIDVAQSLCELEVEARNASRATGLSGIQGDDLNALKAAFGRLADSLEYQQDMIREIVTQQAAA